MNSTGLDEYSMKKSCNGYLITVTRKLLNQSFSRWCGGWRERVKRRRYEGVPEKDLREERSFLVSDLRVAARRQKISKKRVHQIGHHTVEIHCYFFWSSATFY